MSSHYRRQSLRHLRDTPRDLSHGELPTLRRGTRKVVRDLAPLGTGSVFHELLWVGAIGLGLVVDVLFGLGLPGTSQAIGLGAAIIGGSLIGAGGNIAGGLMGGEEDQFRLDTDIPFIQPETSIDPLMQALSALGLLNVGVGGANLEAIIQQGSPLNRVIATIGENPENLKKSRIALTVIYNALAGANVDPGSNRTGMVGDIADLLAPDYQASKDEEMLAVRFLMEAGYSSVEDFVNAQREFQESVPGQLEEMQAQLDAGATIQQVGSQKLAQIVSGFPTVTQDQINAVRAAEEARIAQGFQDQRDALVQQANVLGFNPAAGLGQIARQQETSDLQALEQALALLGGQTQIAAGGLGALQSAVYTPQQMLLDITNLRQGGELGSAGIAANQIAAMAGPLGANVASASNAATNRGTGIAGAGGALASGLTSYAMAPLMQQLTQSPGQTRFGELSQLADIMNSF